MAPRSPSLGMIKVSSPNLNESFDYTSVMTRLIGHLKAPTIESICDLAAADPVYAGFVRVTLMHYFVDTLGLLQDDSPVHIKCSVVGHPILSFDMVYEDRLGYHRYWIKEF